MAEVTKLITCLVLVFYEEGKNAEKFGKTLRKTIIENKLDTLLVCVPSFLYVIQNNLLYVSSTHLDAATNQVSIYKQCSFVWPRFCSTAFGRKRIFIFIHNVHCLGHLPTENLDDSHICGHHFAQETVSYTMGIAGIASGWSCNRTGGSQRARVSAKSAESRRS